jgi:hypothetical protein
MSAKNAFKILKTLKEVDAELAIVQDSRMKLVEKYCQRDENGQWKVDEIGNVLIVPEQITIFTTEQNELFNTTLELNCDKLDIGIFDSLMFTPKMLMDIEDFIEIE